jgi:hypothetical protein
VIEIGVEGIPLQPGEVVDKRAVAAKLGHENLIPQALRRRQILVRGSQPQGIG